MSKYVTARRSEILLEARNRAGVVDGFVPQTHLPGQEAFFAGHVAAFTELGCVPAGDIRYDNLSSAVLRVCFGRSRVETNR